MIDCPEEFMKLCCAPTLTSLVSPRLNEHIKSVIWRDLDKSEGLQGNVIFEKQKESSLANYKLTRKHEPWEVSDILSTDLWKFRVNLNDNIWFG